MYEPNYHILCYLDYYEYEIWIGIFQSWLANWKKTAAFFQKNGFNLVYLNFE